MNLQDIQLTEQDFDMLIEALKVLPEHGSAERALSEIMGNLIAGDDPRLKAHLENEIKKRDKKLAETKKKIEEDAILLKSKLIMLKRYLITNGALKNNK